MAFLELPIRVYMNYKNKRSEYQSSWKQKRRQTWLADNGPCAKCGSWEDLEIDHVDRLTKVIAINSVWNLTETKRLAELSKCQVLCYTCHLVKTTAERAPTHGTDSMYMTGCRCADCKAAHCAYTSFWRSSKRIALILKKDGFAWNVSKRRRKPDHLLK